MALFLFFQNNNLIMNFLKIAFIAGSLIGLVSCKKETEPSPSLNLVFKFNPNQERLDNLGNPSVIKGGNAAQNPVIRKMSGHYVELVPSKYTLLGEGAVIYKGAELPASNDGYTSCIDFSKAKIAGENETFISVPFKDIKPGIYEYMRISVSFQSGDIKFNINDVPYNGNTYDLADQTATLNSFLGYNTKIGTQTVRTKSYTENTPQTQGFWAFETGLVAPYSLFNVIETGKSPAGATTVVNPLEAFGVIIPRGSCIVTGKLDTPLKITGDEVSDKKAILSFSINNSFEWIDTNANGKWDYTYPSTIEQIVDMGLRGLKISVE